MIPPKNFKNRDKNRIKTHDMNMFNMNSTGMKKAKDTAKKMRSASDARIKSDVLGSYTGMFYDGDEPDQDADDL
ncbi:MAG: hypothetical protein FWD71_04610 [Oscillospiraceae bacterium]|nr:hypothetical protein [Oscillospiraceae bacterium]